MNNSKNINDWVFRENTLDAIRLFAAMQVAVIHVYGYLSPASAIDNPLIRLLGLFPGVPIFFFISGFLITRSFERSPSIKEFLKNRALRIFPALWVCLIINILMIASTGYFQDKNISIIDTGSLLIAKATFIQFYNPDFLRGFGDGVLNGSLWTICVELQFYILTPLIYILFIQRAKNANINIIILITVFLLANQALTILQASFSHHIAWKLYKVSFAPWIYMFLLGALAQQNFNAIQRHIKKIPLLPILVIYLIVASLLRNFNFDLGNTITPILLPFLILLILRAAYYKPKVINKVFKGNDISYGVYIWHMVFVNQYLHYNSQGPEITLIALAATIAAAVLSWFFVEKPALSLKTFSLKN